MTIKSLKNKSILVTGASGSIGSEIVKYLLKTNCKVVRALSNDENGLYKLGNEISRQLESNFDYEMKKNKIRFLIGDVRDFKRNLEATKEIDIVIHAAAMKHVPICEYNPKETYKTNVQGTSKLVKASIKNNVKKFLFISTDKAVDPSSIMGKTKFLGEKLVLSSNKKDLKTKFSVIRFGNIIGSRGSVLPYFVSQIKNGRNITITDKNITRFFISIKNATMEIFKSIEIMRGNELFVIKNMRALKILDLAIALKRIFKSKNKVKTIGLRPGEKLHESLFTQSELKRITEKKNLLIITKKKTKNKKKLNNFFNTSELAKHMKIDEITKYLINEIKING
jgi:UDP-N-acetylglucosamine 4,6-dehydratase